MASVEGILTEVGATKVAEAWEGSATLTALSFFRVGEGGYIETIAGKSQRPAEPSLTNLDMLENPGSYPVGLQYYEKAFSPGDITITKGKVRCRLHLEQIEFNGTEIWEAGVFDTDGTMIGYVTYPTGKLKKISYAIESIVYITLLK